MRWCWTPSTHVVAELDFRTRGVDALPNEFHITFRNLACSGHCQSHAVDSLAKLDDFVERLGMPEYFEIRFRSNQTDLGCPSQKRLPVAQQLIGPLGKVFSGRIAEIECEVSTHLMSDQRPWEESFGNAPRLSALDSRHYGFRLGEFRHLQ